LKKIKTDDGGFNPAAFTVGRTRQDDNRISAAEKMLLGLMVDESYYAKRIKKELGYKHFNSPAAKMIAKLVFSICDKEDRITCSRIINHFKDNSVSSLLAEVSHCAETITDKDRVLCDCIARIKKDSVKDRLQELKRQIREAESVKDRARIDKLLGDYNSLIKNSRTE
jgi:hypothetical protein